MDFFFFLIICGVKLYNVRFHSNKYNVGKYSFKESKLNNIYLKQRKGIIFICKKKKKIIQLFA